MNVNETHLAIAKERFLQIMAQNPRGNAKTAAITAIDEAISFREAYTEIITKIENPPQLDSDNDKVAMLKALKLIREAGGNTTDWSIWAQKMAAWGMRPDRWPFPGDDAPGAR